MDRVVLSGVTAVLPRRERDAPAHTTAGKGGEDTTRDTGARESTAGAADAARGRPRDSPGTWVSR